MASLETAPVVVVLAAGMLVTFPKETSAMTFFINNCVFSDTSILFVAMAFVFVVVVESVVAATTTRVQRMMNLMVLEQVGLK